MRNAPPQQYSVNSGRPQVYKSSLYDFQSYAQAGQSSLTFFAIPIGQSGKTKADTNLTLAGQLPKPQSFVCESLEVYFYPGNTIDTVATTATNAAGNADDVYNFLKSGSLEMSLLGQVRILEAPLGRFPPSCAMRLETTSAGTFTAPNQSRTSYATGVGVRYAIEPRMTVFAGEAFSVVMNWPSLVPMSVAARIGVVIGGKLWLNAPAGAN